MFKVEGDFLIMRLPSGRRIRYFKPHLRKDVLHYTGVDTVKRIWCLTSTYGGKLDENAAQGGCRDFLADAMLRFEEIAMPVVMHIHDEPVLEVASADNERVREIMCRVPEWADGFPVATEISRGKRYGK
jgi:DNA polymerase